MPGSKSIRVFNGWFGMDTLSQEQETSTCSAMAEGVGTSDNWGWDSEKKCFWLKENTYYVIHRCPTCKKNFNYPVTVEKCPVCSSETTSKNVWIGRIEPPSEKEWGNSMNKIPTANPDLIKRAQEDLALNPVKEEGFDWQHLRDNL